MERKVLADLLKQMKEIRDGYTNLINKKEEIEVMAEKRLAICAQCHFLNKTGFYLNCELCGCYMPAKARSPRSECKDGKWGAEDDKL